MSTALHSFIDIFDTEFGEGQDAVQLKQIAIPIIQRDYAQGRQDPDVNRIRSCFLDSLYAAVTEKPITLDFIYGNIDDKGIMTPLDGQQRLTTLFLLHWYAARKQNIPVEDMEFLKRFSYETRYSARYFCLELIDYLLRNNDDESVIDIVRISQSEVGIDLEDRIKKLKAYITTL